jgi:hypothetical protein
MSAGEMPPAVNSIVDLLGGDRKGPPATNSGRPPDYKVH